MLKMCSSNGELLVIKNKPQCRPIHWGRLLAINDDLATVD